MKYRRTVTEVDLENTKNEAITEAYEKFKNRMEWAKMFGNAHLVIMVVSIGIAAFGNFRGWLYALGYSLILLFIANVIAGKAKADIQKTINREIDNGNADTY